MRWLVTFAALLLAACGKPAGERPIGKAIEIGTPLGLPPLPVPADNPMTAETVKLGEKLFANPSLICTEQEPPNFSIVPAQACFNLASLSRS